MAIIIYITGDLHGDIRRFQKKARKLRKNDILIVCGDFGFLWDGSKKEKKLLKWIGKRRYTVLFVEGTHDNLDLLEEYPVAEWCGGLVREISGRLKFLCRGQVFQLEDSTLFTFGGGESSDAEVREQNWWVDELPTSAEIDAARANLARHDYQVDYIITHQCSRKTKYFLTMEDNEANILDTFFDEVRQNCKYKRWFFGHYHMNKVIPPKEVAVYDAITSIQSARLP